VPASMVRGSPSMVIWTVSGRIGLGMGDCGCYSCRKIGRERDGGRAFEQMSEKEAGRSQRGCDSEALVPGGKKDGGIFSRPDQRQLIGRGSAEPRPDAERGKGRQLRHVERGPLDHGSYDGMVDAAVFGVILPRGADQQLPGFARLNVEGDRVADGRVRALEMPLSLLHQDSGGEIGRKSAGCINDDLGMEGGTILQPNLSVRCLYATAIE